MTRIFVISCAALGFAMGCGGRVASSGPSKVDIPISDGAYVAKTAGEAAARQLAPPSGPTNEWAFPRVARFTLANGLHVAVVMARALPVVHVRLVVRAGGGDGPTPGVAAVTGDLLTSGGTQALASGDFQRRIEAIATELGVRTSLDSTVLAMPLTKDHLAEGLSLLSQAVREPRFDDGQLLKVKARATEEAEGQARSSGVWVLTHLVFRELFPEKSAYATFGLVPSQIARVDASSIRDFHRRFYVPKAATLVLAGDLDEGEAKVVAERHFGAWIAGGDRPKVEHAAPRPPANRRVVVAHRPGSSQSDIYVAALGPARTSETWAAARVASQVLVGGGNRTSAHAIDLASGEEPVLAYAGAETARTSRAVAALLESRGRLARSPPTSSETESARAYVNDVLAMQMESVGSIADMVVTQAEFGLPDGYWDAYRMQLRAIGPSHVEAVAKKLYAVENVLVVVAGDADVIAPELANFGEVTVVDPEKEFKTMRTIPQATK